MLMVYASVAGLALAACGDPGSRASSLDDDTETEDRDRPSRTEPPGSDTEAVRPYLGELLAAHDRLVNWIVADPSMASDPDNPLIQEFLSLYEPDSPVASELVDQWAQRADEGLVTERFREDLPTNESNLEGEIQMESGDKVTFTFCTVRRHELFDSEGQLTQQIPRVDQPGTGIAVRVDGRWRLRVVAIDPNELECRGEDR